VIGEFFCFFVLFQCGNGTVLGEWLFNNFKRMTLKIFRKFLQKYLTEKFSVL